MRTLILGLLTGSALLGAGAASAYQYGGAKQRQTNANQCSVSGYNIAPGSGNGVAVHINGPMQVGTGSPTTIVTFTNANTASSTNYAVRALSLTLQANSTTNPQLTATINRTIAKPDGTTAVMPYTLSDPLAASSPFPYTAYERQSGQSKSFVSADLWIYVFAGTVWVETQTGNSALGKAYTSMTLLGSVDQAPNYAINVLNACGSTTSTTYNRARVETFTVNYATFQAEVDAKYGKYDGLKFYNGMPYLTSDKVPFIGSGRRRLAAAF